MSNEQEDERRLYRCLRKYKVIVKQFDELIEMVGAATKPPKRRRAASISGGGRSSTANASSQPDQNEVFVQTVSRFLQELRAESHSTVDADGSASIQNSN